MAVKDQDLEVKYDPFLDDLRENGQKGFQRKKGAQRLRPSSEDSAEEGGIEGDSKAFQAYSN